MANMRDASGLLEDTSEATSFNASSRGSSVGD